MGSDSRQRLKVGAAQIETAPGDVGANLRKHLDVVAAARDAGVELLLFPELSLVGHGPGGALLEVAMQQDDPTLSELAAKAGTMRVVVGFIEDAPAAQFHNAAAVLSGGRIEFIHRKVNLATYGRLEEGKYYAQGSHVRSFPLLPPWQTSILICADMWNPALVHLAAVGGTTLLLGPISSAIEAVGGEFDNSGGWDLNARFHALTYGMPVVIANRVGHENELTFWGGSRILDPFGRTLAAAEGAGEQLVIAELDYGTVRRARYLLPTVRDSNSAMILRELERLRRAGDDTEVRV